MKSSLGRATLSVLLGFFAVYGCKTTEQSGSVLAGAGSETSTDGTVKQLTDGRLSLVFSDGQRRIVTPEKSNLKTNREISSTMGSLKNTRVGANIYRGEWVCSKAYEFWSGNVSSDPDTCAVELALKSDSSGEISTFKFVVTTKTAGVSTQTGPGAVVNGVKDWRTLPTQAEIDTLARTINDPQNPYADYRANAPAGNLDLPGTAILAAMNENRRVFETGLWDRNRSYLIGCLVTGYSPTHWSDIMLHYYCGMNEPRYCYTYATSQDGLSRVEAVAGCSGKQVSRFSQDRHVPTFKHVVDTQFLVFQYLMLSQTNAFNDDQQQAIINEYYGVKDPTDKDECEDKRPRRKEDPLGKGEHCLAGKTMRTPLEGRGR